MTDDQIDALAISLLQRMLTSCKWLSAQYILLCLVPFVWSILPSGLPLYIAIYTVLYNFYWELCPKKERSKHLWKPYVTYLVIGALCSVVGLIHFSFFGLLLSPLYGALCYVVHKQWKLKREKSFSTIGKMVTILGICVAIVLLKVISVSWTCKDQGNLQNEKTEILERRNYLIDKLMVKPNKVLQDMPAIIGKQFQGEWALYTCSMFTKSLVNISRLYPETREENLPVIDSLIHIVLSKEIREYDTNRWKEDALTTLDSNTSHLSYISHLAWMIGGYKSIGGSSQYDNLYKSLCAALNRRILQSESLNISTYPGEPIYIPDMLVAIVALKEYALSDKEKYESTVKKWIEKAKSQWLDPETGLLVSFLNTDGSQMTSAPIKGSYSALNSYYLTQIDSDFAKDQYARLKSNFMRTSFLTGLREYRSSNPILSLDVDAGPILLGLSPSGTAFVTGPATIYRDNTVRTGLLRTAEIAGNTVSWNNKRHYILADLSLVGEAIMLAMRTTL